MSQFDNTLEKYFDDFVLNGKPNLEAIWGKCIGCPTGPDVSAHDIVEYIARGQIKTLAVYDLIPGLSIPQIYKAVDWYEKAQKFQRAVAKGDDPLEEKVDAFLQELAEPYEPVTSGAQVDMTRQADTSTGLNGASDMTAVCSCESGSIGVATAGCGVGNVLARAGWTWSW